MVCVARAQGVHWIMQWPGDSRRLLLKSRSPAEGPARRLDAMADVTRETIWPGVSVETLMLMVEQWMGVRATRDLVKLTQDCIGQYIG